MNKLKFCKKHKIWTANCIQCVYEKTIKYFVDTIKLDKCPQCIKDFDAIKNNCSLCGNKLR